MPKAATTSRMALHSCVLATYTKKLKMPNKGKESNSITGGGDL